ncbi:callose synthase 3 [Quercus suber]|uniref:Callose synthase 3 n=1 Tax=Quercus suber TaxID=58331 RepID=A0AAW0K3Y0_QUESU
MEEAFKMRNLLQEFLKKHDGVRLPTILGLREHIFTNSVSSLAWFMSTQENCLETIGQRLLANLLNKWRPKGQDDSPSFFCWTLFGTSNSLIPLMNERFPELGLLQTDCIEMSWIESTIFWADLPNGTSIDALLKRASEPDIFFKAKSDYVKKPITKAGLESIWKLMTEIGFRGLMEWNPYGGRMSEILESETPFPHRAGNIFQILYYVTWVEEGTEVSNHYINLTRTFYNAMTSYVSKDPREAYLNYRDLDIGHASPNGNESLSSAKVYGAKVRFHYGHSDVFDRLFHLTRGGVGKASKGFSTTLREGRVTHHEYIQVGKGRDVGLGQITMFEAKMATGNGEQTLSRDIYRLGQRFDFFRMLSVYFTTVGFYFSTLLTVLTVYVFLYGRLYLILSGLEKELSTERDLQNKPLKEALASQAFVQIGFLLSLPTMMQTSLESGFRSALTDFILMQLPLMDFILMHLQLAPIFFTFSLATKTHYYGKTLLHGIRQFMGRGQGITLVHVKFSANYRLYSRSHFIKGIELTILLLVYQILGQSHRGAVSHFLIILSIWFMVGTWLFAPFLFNPSGFEWQKIVDDWADWNKWISNQGGIGVPPDESWESWWENEQEYLRYCGKSGVIVEILLALRFFIYQYGLLYHLNITKKTKSFRVYGVSWLVIIVIFLVMKVGSIGRRCLSAKFQLLFRLIAGLISLVFVSVFIPLIALPHLTLQDIIVCILAFVPTGWGLLQIAKACKPLIVRAGFWGSVRELARGYESNMGLLLLTPVTLLAWFPFTSEFQTRVLFNPALNRGIQISHILGGA